MADQSPTRPKNVVMVDADNPLVEVRGEFFWREDHDQVVASVRQEAYRDGYTHGWAEATRHPPAHRIVIRRRPSLLARVVRRCVIAVILFAFVTSVALAVLQAIVQA